MVLNRVKVLSLAELNAWRCDADTEVPSDSEALASLDMSFEDSAQEGGSDADTPIERAGPFSTTSSSSATGSSSRVEGGRPQPLQQPCAVEHLLQTRSDKLKAIFLDYDGTLREFEAKPELAVPTPEVHRLLSALNAREDFLVHIISGRDAQFLSTHLGRYHRLTLIAEHERRVAGRFQVWRPDADASAVQGQGQAEPMQDWRTTVRFEMARISGRLDGGQIEEKASSLVWHFRAVANEAAGEAAAVALVNRLGQLVKARRLRDLKVSRHSKTVEVSCRSTTKGHIMRRICESRASMGEPFEAVLVAGDDVSDESMFEYGCGENFLTVKVGVDKTMAKYYVQTPGELREFLWRFVS